MFSPNGLTVDGLIEFTPSQLETRAADFLRSRPDVDSDVLPIDVEKLLDDYGDVQIETKTSLRANHGVEGCVCNEERSRKLTVFVDRAIANGPSDAAYSEVVGEELAHIELHRAIIHQISSVEAFVEVRNHPQWRRMELDAERYSRAIRMPHRHVEHEAAVAYVQAIKRFGYSSPDATHAMMRNLLAEKFVVSASTALKRIAQWPLSWVGQSVHLSVALQRPELIPESGLKSLPANDRQTSFL